MNMCGTFKCIWCSHWKCGLYSRPESRTPMTAVKKDVSHSQSQVTKDMMEDRIARVQCLGSAASGLLLA